MGNGEESGKTVGNGKGKEPSHLSNEVGVTGEAMNVDEDATGAAEAVAQALGGELEEMRDLVVKRAQELEELRNDRVALKNEIDSLKVKVRFSRILNFFSFGGRNADTPRSFIIARGSTGRHHR